MSKAKNKDTRILVVDDEPMMSDSLRQHLSDEGYAVDVSSSGTQAIDLFDGGAHQAEAGIADGGLSVGAKACR